MIHKSHMVGAVYGMERMMGKDHTPVRKIFDYGMEHFLKDRPILFVLTVCTAPEAESAMHGLFIGEGRNCLTEAVKLAQERNIDFVEHGIRKCVVYLDPSEFKSTWLGNKAVYRTRMAIADGGELIILAPGVTKFGEDAQVDRLIHKYGYRGRLRTLEAFNKPENTDLREKRCSLCRTAMYHVENGNFVRTIGAGRRRTKGRAAFCSAPFGQDAQRTVPLLSCSCSLSAMRAMNSELVGLPLVLETV